MTSQRDSELRRQLVHCAQRLEPEGLSIGKSGNLSARCGDRILITPSGVAYAELTPAAIVAVDIAGNTLDPDALTPSSEWRIHCDLYRARADIHAIVHAHAPASTALACTGRHIPAFHYMVAVAGGSDIPLAEYALFGSAELSQAINRAMDNRSACLLANHGLLACADTVAAAFNLAREVEALADQYSRALQLGDVKLLNDAQMREVLAQFKHYGQRNR